MNTQRLVEISDMFSGCKSLEELASLRNQVRAEVKQMDRSSQEWLLGELLSCEYRFNNPGISDEEFNRILKKAEKDESKRKSSKGERKYGSFRTRQKTAKDRGTDSLAIWKEAFPSSK